MIAQELGWDFYDLDYMLELEMQKSVGSIFEDHGEEIFRKLEKETLQKTASLKNAVISCGGGTACFEGNMDWMQKQGLTIFLNPPIETIIPRILKNKNKRPLFKGLKEGQLRHKLNEFAVKRGEFYSKARFIWNKEEPNAKMYSAVNQLLKIYS